MQIKDKLKRLIPDEIYLKWLFRKMTGNNLNLKNPKTYNEKLQWLKLYDRNPLYTKMVDKYEVKKIVSSRLGEGYVIPTLGIWENFDDIDFNCLPEKFVLKTTHDSGTVYICTDKTRFDITKTRNEINKSLKNNFYYYAREWPYKNVKPRVMAEQYMENAATGDLRDYKFFTFNGKARLLFIATQRQCEETETKYDFFDMDFNHLAFTHGHPNADISPQKPERFEEMKEMAERLSDGMAHVRVDLYEVDGKIYFGEMTFYSSGGMVPFDPPEWDYKLGEWIELPKNKKSYTEM